MIIIPKYQDLILPRPIVAPVRVGGEFRCILRDLNGRVLRDTGWFRNLITDYGLNTGFRGEFWSQYMLIGSDATAPTVSDVSLGSWLGAASIPSITDVTSPNPVAPNYEWYTTKRARFNAGEGTGTVREIGLSVDNDNTKMSIRAVLAAPIVKGVDKVLDVYYKFWRWPDITDNTGQILIATENYDYTIRGGELDAASAGTYAWNSFDNYSPKGNSTAHLAYESDISTIDSKQDPGTQTPDPWSSNNPVALGGVNNYWDWEFHWGLDRGNGTSGIRSFFLYSNFAYVGAAGLQIGFYRVSDNAEIQKDETKTFTMQVRYQWSRH